MKNYKMNSSEIQVTLSFCIIFLLRMLGMFMILPVLSKYAILLNGSNKFLIGISVGIYGIAQVIFQIPFGILSDIFGRKKMIILGLLMFFVGSVIAASNHSIWGLIIGRTLQGSGAISGVSIAFLSDLIREENRIKSIAAIGASFGLSFLIAIIIGPIIVQYFGFFSLFWMSAFLSVICICIAFFILPAYTENVSKQNINITYKKMIKLSINKNFFRYYAGIFCLHFLLMINFIVLPNELELSGLLLKNHWQVYLSTIVFSFCVLFVFIFYCKISFILKNIIEICISCLVVSGIIFFKSGNNLINFICALQVFFIAFNFLEVFLPSYLSKKAPGNYKGSIMSIYSTSQFLGIFFGGVFSGVLCSFLSVSQIFLFEIFFILLWLIISYLIKNKFEL